MINWLTSAVAPLLMGRGVLPARVADAGALAPKLPSVYTEGLGLFLAIARRKVEGGPNFETTS